MQQFAEFVTNHWDLFVALAIILVLFVAPTVNRRLKGFKEVDVPEAVAMMNHQDAVLLDVRENNEYSEGHVQGSMHVPMSGFAKQLGTLDTLREKPVIVGCRSGARSARAAGILRKQGFEAVYNLKGGILAWENAGLPLTKGGKKKKRKGA